jgi:hypothetical protein
MIENKKISESLENVDDKQESSDSESSEEVLP